MSMRLAARAAAGLVAALAAVAVPVVPAGAVELAGTASIGTHRAGEPTEHCAIGLDAAAAADQAEADAPDPVCFATLAEVDQYLAEQTADDGSRLTAAAASVAVGRVYKDTNKNGSSLTFWGTSGCAGVVFGFPTLSSSWSTSISSATGLNGCWATLYTATSYGGSRLNCTAYCSSIGSFNDRVKSIVFRPTGTLG